MFAFAIAIACASCARAPRPEVAPNVLLVTFDTTRFDRLGCTGDPEARTPTVDALAARGLLFTRAYASTSLTLPSHTTILSGLEPRTHGIHNNGREAVPEAVETLAERLQAAGWETGAFVSALVLDRRFNLDQGFGTYGDQTRAAAGPLNFMVPTRPGIEVTDEALTWLGKRKGDRPFFLWTHYYDPHLPRDVKPPFDAFPDPYAAEIAYADDQLGRLLAAIESSAGGRPTLVVFTADHGESFGEHGESTHGILAYDSTLRVPLVIAGPGVPSGARSEALARHIDIVPTVLRAAGLAVSAELPGRDLVAAGTMPGGEDDAVGYFESHGPHQDLGWAEIEGVRTGRWKYTAAPAPGELYDVLADPREIENRIDLEPEVRARMEGRWLRLQKDQPEASAADTVELDVADLERLAALGYVQAAGSFRDEGAPDPRRSVAVFTWVEEARTRASVGRYEEAIGALEALAQSDSVRSLVLRSLAPVYAASGRFDDAIRTYRAYIESTDSMEAKFSLARTLLYAGRPAEAVAHIDALGQRGGQWRMLRALALGRLGRHAEARSEVDHLFAGGRQEDERRRQRAALVIDAAPIDDGERELRALLAQAPDDPVLKSRLGYYLAVWGDGTRGAEALELLKDAARVKSEDADLLANLGWGAHRLGRQQEAASALEKAVDLDAGRLLDWMRLAIVLRELGDEDRSRRLAQAALAAHPGAEWAQAARELLADLEGAPRTQAKEARS